VCTTGGGTGKSTVVTLPTVRVGTLTNSFTYNNPSVVFLFHDPHSVLHYHLATALELWLVKMCLCTQKQARQDKFFGLVLSSLLLGSLQLLCQVSSSDYLLAHFLSFCRCLDLV